MLRSVLALPDGRIANAAATWHATHRPALLDLLDQCIYGPAPPASAINATRVAAGDLPHGTWEDWRIALWPDTPPLSVLLCLPHRLPAPCYLGLNFRGNHTVSRAEVPAPAGFGAYGVPDVRDAHRSTMDWCVDGITRRGWGLCTAFYGELEPDRAEGPALSRTWRSAGLPAGALSAWAWLIQRLVDLLAADARCDARRMVAIGHSRLGKAALLATARDPRIAMAVANGSGCGGAACFADCSPGAETLAQILRFSHWFHPALAPDPAAVPVDMHHLLACIAPRPLLLTNAEDDDWADQAGQLRTLQAAAPAWHLLGVQAQPPSALPALGGGAAGSVLRYAWRVGPHCLCPADWAAVFAATAAELPG